MTLSKEKAKKRTTRGAILLDEKHPHWVHSIDLETFSLSSSCNCVLGQVYGSYIQGHTTLNLISQTALHHGFDLLSLRFDQATRDNYEALEKEWVELIKERQTS